MIRLQHFAVGSIGAIQAVKGVLDTVNSTLNDVKSYANNILGSLGDNTFGTVQQLLQQGFTQEANYSQSADWRAGTDYRRIQYRHGSVPP